MCGWPQSLTKLISNYKLLLYKVNSKFDGIVTKLISNYTLLLYKLKSKFGATVTKLIFNHMLLLYKVKSKFGATMSKLISNYTLWLHCNSYASTGLPRIKFCWNATFLMDCHWSERKAQRNIKESWFILWIWHPRK